MLTFAETGLVAYVSDTDMTSLYPSIMRATNAARGTMTFAPYFIEGKSQVEVQRYFANLVNIRENAELLCYEYHGLPSYTGMKQLIKQRIAQSQLLYKFKNYVLEDNRNGFHLLHW